MQLVPDVCQFEGHIACDPNSRSELVVPVLVDGVMIGLLDMDSPHCNGFEEEDQQQVEKLVQVLVESCDWSPLLQMLQPRSGST